MSATVTYKGDTLTTVNNETKVLNTAGTWVEGDISITDETSTGAVVVTDTPDPNGGTIREITSQNTVTLQNVKNYTLTTSSATITPDTGYDGFASLEVTTSEREDLTEPKDVDFIDYDGRLIYSYTASEFMNLTALPANPVNAGLVAQGWNWTLADAQDFVGKYGALVVGQNYTTDTGRTRIYIHIPENPVEWRTLDVCVTSSVNNGVKVYWGDGAETLTRGTVSHTYTNSGDYIVELEVLDGEVSIGATANSSIVGGSYCRYWVKKVEIGDGISILRQTTFGRLESLQSVSVPVSVTTLYNYDEMMFPRSLKAFVFPINLTTDRYRAMCPNYCHLKYVSIPKGMNNFHMDTAPQQLRKLTMYSMEPASGTSMTVRLYAGPKITHFVVMGTYTTIVDDTCRNSAIRKLFIPASVTNINGITTFAYNSLLKEIHLYPVAPPVLSNVGAFRDLPSDAIMYVPYSADHSILQAYQTATNWSTFADKMQEEPQS